MFSDRIIKKMEKYHVFQAIIICTHSFFKYWFDLIFMTAPKLCHLFLSHSFIHFVFFFFHCISMWYIYIRWVWNHKIEKLLINKYSFRIWFRNDLIYERWFKWTGEMSFMFEHFGQINYLLVLAIGLDTLGHLIKTI